MSSIPDYLSKTEFRVGSSCPTKLYYLKKGYRSTDDENDYLEFLKDGGHIIGEMARQLRPEGTYIGLEEGLPSALKRTAAALEAEDTTLFEAPFVSGGMLAVVDILEKRGGVLKILEVKSKSFDSTSEYEIVGKKGDIKAAWREYIEDVGFQALVVAEAYPQFEVKPHLLLPDKSKRATVEALGAWFDISGDTSKFRVTFKGERSELAKSDFLTEVDVEEPCRVIANQVRTDALRLVKLLNPTLQRVQYHLGKHCKGCEFNTGEEASGFSECWGELGKVSPHVFDLYFGGALKVDGKFLLDELIAKKRVSLFDIPDDAIKGKRGERQRVQIENTRSGSEWIRPTFKLELEEYRWPLHFIDFETSTSAVPYHAGMRPYEQVAFQWSCHTLSAPGAELKHTEWINLEDSFPSFRFAETLRETLSDQGTIFMWADHENRVLKEIRRQMVDYEHKSPELSEWIDRVVVTKETPGRLIDMEKLCREYYFHPEMKGRTSIKYVLPAIWNNNDYLWDLSHFRDYVLRGEDGKVLSPYEALEPIEVAGQFRIVKEGSSAMNAYQELMFGFSRGNADLRREWAKLLLQYCKLDTLAMVVCWTHWRKLLSLPI